jgi:hypothetical protein
MNLRDAAIWLLARVRQQVIVGVSDKGYHCTLCSSKIAPTRQEVQHREGCEFDAAQKAVNG